jgi:hypothetical protein
MNITFQRISERSYGTTAVRDDGVKLRIPSYDRLASPPHDLAHYVVEKSLGLRRGFWGSVADGALFPGMEALSGRLPARGAERSKTLLREAGRQGVEAEVFVSLMLELMDEDFVKRGNAVRAALAGVWKPAKPSRGPVTFEEARRVCQELREIRERWRSLAMGESLTVIWTLDKRIGR